MNVLTLPRTVAALEYKALRLPATLLQSQVVVRFLDDDSKLRLGFEKALGTLDEKAGSLLANDALTDRGRVLRRRSEVLAKAVELEEVADQRKQAAEATLREGTKKAQKTRERAKAQQGQGVQQALQEEQADKARAERAANARAQAEKKRVEDRTRAKVQSVTSQLDAQEARIDATERARTAAPVAQLTEAVSGKKTADAERRKAERLAALADAEKQNRQAARS
ncbi:MAG: putative translation initiation factor, family protein [Frankiales bacterium]|jgi:hypothetical protein|nr:putative translation initiation factor, family protein [Frankiales bacterium]